MQKYKVNVTEMDTVLGKPTNCKKCPIAKAMSRLKIFKDKILIVAPVNWYTGDYTMRGPLPIEATTFIARFDSHGDAEPFSFYIYI